MLIKLPFARSHNLSLALRFFSSLLLPPTLAPIHHAHAQSKRLLKIASIFLFPTIMRAQHMLCEFTCASLFPFLFSFLFYLPLTYFFSVLFLFSLSFPCLQSSVLLSLFLSLSLSLSLSLTLSFLVFFCNYTIFLYRIPIIL